MVDRLTDIGPPKYDEMWPEIVRANYGTWKTHLILEPGVIKHVSETGAELYSVRCAGTRLMTTLFLEDIYVREEERMQGIGGKLFRHCVREAIAKGCGRMEWCALNWNVGAMAFYERQGARRMDWTFFRLDREAMERLEAKEGAARLV